MRSTLYPSREWGKPGRPLRGFGAIVWSFPERSQRICGSLACALQQMLACTLPGCGCQRVFFVRTIIFKENEGWSGEVGGGDADLTPS